MKLSHKLWCGALCLILGVACSPEASKDSGDTRTYQLVWSDEFDGASLDLAKWNYEVHGGGGGNGELQYYTDRPENLRLENGLLVIEARKEDYQGKKYTSARINTREKAKFAYSKIECRLSVPAGKGTWPAFWMLGAGWPSTMWPFCGEIDIMEHVGKDPRMFSHALHTQNRNGGAGWTSKKWFDTSVEDKFYVFTVERTAAKGDSVSSTIKFFIDGEEIGYSEQRSKELADWPFNQDFFLILNLAIGGSWGGTVDDTIFDSPVLFKVDYVRVYELR